ncbi:MAG: bifunctional hydroxymethylpyrimidine kinase/phosphomethylpyrimidine kinase [Lachnospiraceae bacterium]
MVRPVFFVFGKQIFSKGGILIKICLTIAGSDCSGGAGIQADLKTFSALGCFGMSVIVSVVAENTSRVISIMEVPPRTICDQMDAVFEDCKIHAVKVGMLPDAASMAATAEKLREYSPQAIVVDPVMIAKGGCALMRPEALLAFQEQILPLAFLLTPNIPEAIALTGSRIESISDMEEAAKRMWEMGAQNVLVKGGHLEGAAADILYDGSRIHTFVEERIPTKNTHGTGCTLSSAITARLALGEALPQAVQYAKNYVTEAIRYGLEIGQGHGPTNHFYEFYKMKGWIEE